MSSEILGYERKEVGEHLSRRYSHLVVDPYSVSLRQQGAYRGDTRFSFYSSFIINAAYKLQQAGVAENMILFSDASFGSKKASTADLMKEFLCKKGVSSDKIITFDEPELNQTATQVKRLKLFRKEQSLTEPFLYIVWNYHAQRVQNHLHGFGVPADVVSTIDVQEHFVPTFNRDRLLNVLPLEELEAMEKTRRLVSRVDTRGYLPRMLKPFLGAYTLDNKREEDGRLSLSYAPGKKVIEVFNK